MAKLADAPKFYHRRGDVNGGGEVNLELYGAWLGGAMFAALDSSAVERRSMTREQWFAQEVAEKSPAAVAEQESKVVYEFSGAKTVNSANK